MAFLLGRVPGFRGGNGGGEGGSERGDPTQQRRGFLAARFGAPGEKQESGRLAGWSRGPSGKEAAPPARNAFRAEAASELVPLPTTVGRLRPSEPSHPRIKSPAVQRRHGEGGGEPAIPGKGGAGELTWEGSAHPTVLGGCPEPGVLLGCSAKNSLCFGGNSPGIKGRLARPPSPGSAPGQSSLAEDTGQGAGGGQGERGGGEC